MTLRLDVFHGETIAPHLDAVAALRIAVFADYPYLYEGDLDYERGYLQRYARSPRSLFVLARDGEAVVGASTAILLADDAETFQAPFRAAGIDPATVFYFGESVLRRDYRGRGIGHGFFDAREARARELGLAVCAFCAVDRAADDPRRPADYRGNEVFWGKRGYLRQPGMYCTLDWPEPGLGDVRHTLTFWLRRLAA